MVAMSKHLANERAHDGYSRNGEAANQSEEPKLLAFNFETFAP
jgi:hypothetical protein